VIAGVDYLAAASHWPGTGRYARELVRALAGLDPADAGGFELRLFDVGRAERAVDAAALGLEAGARHVRRVTRAIPRRALPALALLGWDAARILGGVDLLHHVHVEGPPVRRARQVLALAELPPAGSAAHAALVERARALDGFVVFAQAWRARVARELCVPPERVHYTPVGCEHWQRALAERPPPDDPPLILALGATRRARAPLALLAAFERLAARGSDARLIWAGRDGDAEGEFEAARRASALGARVERRRDPTERELPPLVARAAVLVHLDPQAGTPVTPLEALALGPAVVASRVPVHEEHLAGLAELVDDAEVARDPARLADAIERALAARRDPAQAERRTARAAAHTWERCARATLAAWRAVLDAPAQRTGLRAVQ
jgi:glycosyltransferase involved in cell wall biosynthesis